MWNPGTRAGEPQGGGDIADVQRALATLARTVGSCCADDLAQMRQELGQIRSLTATAIQALQSSFRELDTLVRSQADTLDSLLSLGGGRSTDGELNIASFVGEVGPLCRSLSEVVTSVVARGQEGAARAQTLASDVAATMELLRQFQTVEARTFILGLNAAIEAARAGEQGNAFAIVAQEVRSLATYSKELNARIADQLERAQAALRGVRVTLVESASRDVEGARESQGRIDDLLRKLGALDLRMGRDLAQIRLVSEQVNQQVAIAVQALQFEDMTTQLTDCMEKRIARIDASLTCLQKAGQASADSATALGSALLEQADAVVELYATEVHSPVAQQDTTSGSVDFF